MKKEQEFFDKVEEVLHAYTESYEEGAWEDFEVHRRKNRNIWLFSSWSAIAAAAVVLLFVYILFELNGATSFKEKTIVKKAEQLTPKQPIEQVVVDPLVIENETLLAKQFKREDHPVKIVRENDGENHKDLEQMTDPYQFLKENVVVKILKDNAAQSGVVSTIINEERIGNSTVVTEEMIKNEIVKYNKSVTLGQVSASSYDSLINKNSATRAAKNDESSFTYSVVVSPSLSNQKVNFGAGMEISYKLGNRFSINSGLIYNELSAKSNGKSLASASSFSQDANLALSGLEIPIGLQYQINNGFYASVGVSGMSLIHNRLEYSYQENRVASMPVANSGGYEDVIKLVSEQRTAQAKEDLNNYIGFFTISAGKKQAFGNSNLNIGPFLKIPFNSVSTEKIRLFQGGFKLSFDF